MILFFTCSPKNKVETSLRSLFFSPSSRLLFFLNDNRSITGYRVNDVLFETEITWPYVRKKASKKYKYKKKKVLQPINNAPIMTAARSYGRNKSSTRILYELVPKILKVFPFLA